MILFIKHIDIEGPETLGAFFQRHGFNCRTVDLGQGEALPQDLADIQAVIVLGGPMNVDEEDQYPFLKPENAFIQQVLRQEIPYLGICLGSQLLAKACGARVTKNPVEEIGWSSVRLTASGKNDTLFAGLAEEVLVFQWHGDTFAIPSGAQCLASSSACAHQALKVGRYAYGLQFHVEITDKSIREWSDEYFKDPGVLQERKAQMLAGYQRQRDEFHAIGETIFSNFLKLIKISNESRAVKQSR